MSSNLVIVESPTKAKTIKKFLPKEYKVLCSMGHIRDLPSSSKEIPEAVRKESWASLGIDYLNNFTPCYVIPASKKSLVTNLKKELKSADTLILATDDDREGESISWHLKEILQPKIPIKRMVFHQISKKAILESLNNFRDINLNLVSAQETRRILDRLVGYTISPLLWRKITNKLSAGRVQSVAVNTIVEKEIERMKFVSAKYWGLDALVEKDKILFEVFLSELDDKKLATAKDFDPSTGKLNNKDKHLLNEAEANKLQGKLKKHSWVVKSVNTKQQEQEPYPPFITATLQQEASSKLRFSARETMGIAQKLYEKGYITYMRTDSVTLAPTTITSIRNIVEKKWGKEYLHPHIRVYKSKAKNAQEAHEAIHPVDFSIQASQLNETLAENKLYDLIWKRAVASQMSAILKEFCHIDIEVENCIFHGIGKKILHKGFSILEGTVDKDKQQVLPLLKKNDKVAVQEIKINKHETAPPSRYSEAGLIKFLEKEEIGRPSTYASIIDTIFNRNYAKKVSDALVPTFTAFAVAKLIKENFTDLIDLKFTAKIENKLDEIADGKVNWQEYLNEFYNGKKGLLYIAEAKNKTIEAETYKKIQLPNLPEIRISRYGPYIQIEENKEVKNINIPPNTLPADLNPSYIEEISKSGNDGNQIGVEPKSGLPILLLHGIYGFYLQLGISDSKAKPKRVTIPKNINPSQVNLELAIKLLSLPINLGEHPQGGKIEIGVGKYGPYISRTFIDNKKDFRSINNEDIAKISLQDAINILKESKGTKRGAKALRQIGEHPIDKNAIALYLGPYGHYLKYGNINVAIPKDKNIDKIDLKEALQIIEEKSKKENKTKLRKRI